MLAIMNQRRYQYEVLCYNLYYISCYFEKILNKRDVLIIGGGPAGSRVATKLSRSGVDVIVMDKKPSAGGRICCTGLISLDCLEHFSIDRNAILRDFNHASILSPSGKSIEIKRPTVQACAIDRSMLDLAMSQQAIDSGAKYYFNHKVTGLELKPDGINVMAENSHGTVNHEVGAVVLAGGCSGVSLSPGFKTRDCVIGTQLEVEMTGQELEIYLGKQFAPGFFAWLVPLNGTRGLAGLMARRNVRKYIDAFVSFLYDHGKIKNVKTVPVFRGITLKPPRLTYGERTLVVGDAAGQVKPITGGGIYYGLLCADIAADCLYAAISAGDLSSQRLAEYQQKWQKLLGRELKTAYRARKIYEKASDALIEHVFNMNRTSKLLESLANTQSIGFDWHSQAIMAAVKHFLL
jgi:geranylgeranyl reductase family protein